MKHDLFSVLQHIRTLAGNIFDKAEAHSVPMQEVHDKIAPLRQMARECINNSPDKNLMMALKDFEHLELSHRESIKYYEEKMRDAREHARNIKEEIISRIKLSGKDYLADGDFRANLVTVGDEERVIVR